MIKVDEEFYIDADKYSWQVLKKVFNEKQQKEEFRGVCYPSSLRGCIEWIMRFKQRNVAEKDLSLVGALSEIEKINKEMKGILDRIEKKEKL